MRLYKTYKVKIACNEEEKLSALQKYWFRLINACVKLTVRLGKTRQLDLQYAAYSALRKYTIEKWNLHSQHLCSAIKTSSEIVRSCIEACKTNCRTRFPTVPRDIPITLTSNTVKFISSGNDTYALIAFQPHNPISAKLNVPLYLDFYEELRLALQGKIFRIKGAKLLERKGIWWLYVSVEKDIAVPRGEDCETFVGVDVGMNYLIAMTAVSRDKKVHPTVYVKGKLWKHLQKYKRSKVRKLQSKGANTESIYTYYSERFKEILNKTSNKVIEYAKQFPKPLIVMGELKGLRSKNDFNKKFNFLLSNWQRRKLEQLIEYKAHWNGIPVRYVYEWYTSVTCHACGNKGVRMETLFYCPICNRKFNSDGNASINIALRGSNFSNDKPMDDRRRTVGLISPTGVGSPTPQTTFSLTGELDATGEGGA